MEVNSIHVSSHKFERIPPPSKVGGIWLAFVLKARALNLLARVDLQPGNLPQIFFIVRLFLALEILKAMSTPALLPEDAAFPGSRRVSATPGRFRPSKDR